MLHPVIMAVVDESNEPVKIEQELQKRYGADYCVVCQDSAKTALDHLRELKAAGADVAVVLADQRLPEMSGTEFLSRAHQLYPTVKRALLLPQMAVRWDDPIINPRWPGYEVVDPP